MLLASTFLGAGCCSEASLSEASARGSEASARDPAQRLVSGSSGAAFWAQPLQAGLRCVATGGAMPALVQSVLQKPCIASLRCATRLRAQVSGQIKVYGGIKRHSGQHP